MNTLLFVRHAETDLAGRFCGHSNPPVNNRGFRQIEGLLEILKSEPVDAIYSSDLVRSFTTAEAIGSLFEISPVVLPALREINFGDWETLSWPEIESRDQEYARQWLSSYPNLPASGGECFQTFQWRVLGAINGLLSEVSEKRSVIVTHAGVMRVVLRALCGLSEEDAWKQTESYCGFFRYQQGRLV